MNVTTGTEFRIDSPDKTLNKGKAIVSRIKLYDAIDGFKANVFFIVVNESGEIVNADLEISDDMLHQHLTDGTFTIIS